jgi:hypothetical protein
MKNNWKPDGTGVMNGGDVGGDIQVADSWDIRFVHPDLPRAVITVWVYPVAEDPETQWETGPYKVDVQAEYTICDDPRNPGDTEEWADARYETEPGEHADLPAAERAARKIADQFAAGRRLPARNWDGKYFR